MTAEPGFERAWLSDWGSAQDDEHTFMEQVANAALAEVGLRDRFTIGVVNGSFFAYPPTTNGSDEAAFERASSLAYEANERRRAAGEDRP